MAGVQLRVASCRLALSFGGAAVASTEAAELERGESGNLRHTLAVLVLVCSARGLPPHCDLLWNRIGSKLGGLQFVSNQLTCRWPGLCSRSYSTTVNQPVPDAPRMASACRQQAALFMLLYSCGMLHE